MTRRAAWFFGFLGFTVSIVQLVMLRGKLWPQLGVVDWLSSPCCSCRRCMRSGVTSGMFET
jgi:hypothetical protein